MKAIQKQSDKPVKPLSLFRPSHTMFADNSIKVSEENLPTDYYNARTVDEIGEIKGHAADAIINKQKINEMITEGYSRGDYCKITRFILGINTGFRDSDLRNIKVEDIFKSNGEVKDFYAAYEIKTLHTRKIPKPRMVYLNDTVKKALTFLVKVTEKRPQDYLFTADKKTHLRKYIVGFYTDEKGRIKAIKSLEKFSEEGIERLEAYMETAEYAVYLKKLSQSLGMTEHCSTHCQRKTYSWFIRMITSQWEIDNNIIYTDKDMELLRRDLGHTSLSTTADYYSGMDFRIEQHRQLELNLVKEAVDKFVDNFMQTETESN